RADDSRDRPRLEARRLDHTAQGSHTPVCGRRPFILPLTPRPPGSTLFPYTTLFRSLFERIPLAAQRALPLPLEGLAPAGATDERSEEHTSELQSLRQLVCRLLLEKKKSSRAPSTGPSGPRRRRHEPSKEIAPPARPG